MHYYYTPRIHASLNVSFIVDLVDQLHVYNIGDCQCANVLREVFHSNKTSSCVVLGSVLLHRAVGA